MTSHERGRWRARHRSHRPTMTFQTWTAGVAPTRLWLRLRPGALAALVAALALVATLLPATSGQAAGGSSEVVFPPAGHVFAAEDIPEFTVRATDPEGEPYVTQFVATGVDDDADYPFAAPPAASGETATGRPNEQLPPQDYTWTATFTTPTGGNPIDVDGTFTVLEGIVSDDCDEGTTIIDGVVGTVGGAGLGTVAGPYSKVATTQVAPDVAHLCPLYQFQDWEGGAEPEGRRVTLMSADGTPLVVVPELGPCTADGVKLLDGEVGDPDGPIGAFVLYGGTESGGVTLCVRAGNTDVPASMIEASVSVSSATGVPLDMQVFEDTVAATPGKHLYDDPDDPSLASSSCHSSGWVRATVDFELLGGSRFMFRQSQASAVAPSGEGMWTEDFCVRVEPSSGVAVGGHLAVAYYAEQWLETAADKDWHAADSLCPVQWLHFDAPVAFDLHTSQPGTNPAVVCVQGTEMHFSSEGADPAITFTPDA